MARKQQTLQNKQTHKNKHKQTHKQTPNTKQGQGNKGKETLRRQYIKNNI